MAAAKGSMTEESSALSIREMREADLDALSRLLLIPSISESLRWRPSPEEIMDACARYWRDPDEANYLIERNGDMIGWIKLNGLAGQETLWISMLAIHPEHQGKRVGRTALDWAERFARDNAFRRVGIQTTADNCPAIALYVKAGYRMEPSREDAGRYVFTKDVAGPVGQP
jgi:GNAT superfamily N-acetyltransferase